MRRVRSLDRLVQRAEFYYRLDRAEYLEQKNIYSKSTSRGVIDVGPHTRNEFQHYIYGIKIK